MPNQHISRQCLERLRKEYMQIKKNPIPNIECAPLEDNILEWHYVIYDLPESEPYYGGFYHGKLIFSPDYPYKPPGIMMITPNGRFQVNTRLCLSISDFHPESWNPLWSVQSILTGLLSFMLDNQSTYGSISTNDDQKKQFARESISFNRKDKVFKTLFAELLATKIDESEKRFALTNPDVPKEKTTSSSPPSTSSWTTKLFHFALFSIVVSFIAYLAY